VRYQHFGKTDLTVSEIGFGCAGIGGLFQASRREQVSLLRQALDDGITFYDTADMYAQGQSERMLGEAFRSNRDEVIIASKVGYLFASRLKQQGKIRYWGMACDEPEHALPSLQLPGIASIQVSLSLLHPEALDVVIPRASERGVGVIARQVFASGLLTKAAEGLKASASVDDARRAAIDTLRGLATERGLSLPELALDFAIAQKGVSVTLLGMHAQHHLAENRGYLKRLSREPSRPPSSSTTPTGDGSDRRSC